MSCIQKFFLFIIIPTFSCHAIHQNCSLLSKYAGKSIVFKLNFCLFLPLIFELAVAFPYDKAEKVFTETQLTWSSS